MLSRAIVHLLDAGYVLGCETVPSHPMMLIAARARSARPLTFGCWVC